MTELFDQTGRRKYLTPEERQAFLLAAEAAPGAVRTFCWTLAHTGCRISEALALTADRVDVGGGVLVFETLKKRRRGVYRAVPAPPELLREIAEVHDLGPQDEARLWRWSRTTAWRRVRAVMEEAGLAGLHAVPKGLRHGFGVQAVTSCVPLNMAQKWLGHSRLATTAIYTDAVGPEEQMLARRMWDRSSNHRARGP